MRFWVGVTDDDWYRIPSVGCILLNEPFFFPREQWIPAPADWKPNIVVGKGYDTADSVGARVWAPVAERLLSLGRTVVRPGPGARAGRVLEVPGGFGAEYLRKARLGQSAFRVLVTEAYERKCAVTGEKTLPVLEAAHIRPVSEEGPNRTDNGLLLRSDLHILFDKGYLTVTPEHRILVSRRIREEFHNGREYYPFDGKELRVVPGPAEEKPSPEYLRWHNEKIFVG